MDASEGGQMDPCDDYRIKGKRRNLENFSPPKNQWVLVMD